MLCFEFPLLPKDPSAHFKHGLESLAALLGILAEPLDARFLDLVLDLLPAAADGRDLRVLRELGLGRGHRRRRLVDHGFLDVEHVRPRQVRRAHGYFLRHRVDVGDLVDVRRRGAAEQAQDPLWDRLMAGYQTFCAELEKTVRLATAQK